MPSNTVRTYDEKKRQDAKRKSTIVALAGKPITKTAEQVEQETNFKYRGDMNLMLGRGKVIDAIIEMAVNSDFGGEVRAVINRDVYSEWGNNILIPKGSRVFGSYAAGIGQSYGRIAIAWNRIDLANGYTVNLSGTGIDNLGRKGTQGQVDNKFTERLSNAVLRSVVNIAVAKSLDKLIPPKTTSTAAADQTSEATSIRNITNTIFSGAGTPAEKRERICAQVVNAIADKTSSAATTIQAACEKLRTDTTGSDEAKLTSLMSTINTAADALLANISADVEDTKAQKASTKAYTDLGDTIESFVEEQEFKPTITIDQGTIVKIYVNKDYKFPKNAIKKARWMQ
ncbi:MAG: TrbI/VirB10 family protein [Rickettsiaceae bacterium]